MTGLLQVVYKRYASLYFVMGVDSTDNELLTLEIIHHFVEVLDRYFGNVCELDLIFNFHKVRQALRCCNRMHLTSKGLLSSAARSALRSRPGVRRSVSLLLYCAALGLSALLALSARRALFSASLKCCSACCRCSKVQMTVNGCSQVLKACFEIWA